MRKILDIVRADLLEATPARYLPIPADDARVGWGDMDAFVDTLPPGDARDRLARALPGRGAFRRFKDEVYALDLRETWYPFPEARQAERARAWLEDEGLQAATPPPGQPTAEDP